MSDHHDHRHNKVISRVGSAAFSDATNAIIDTHSAVKTLAITVTLEIVAVAMFTIAKDKVVELVENSGDDLWFYGGAVFFFNGFFIAFALYRLIADRWPHRGMQIFIWLISFAAGALNVLVLFALYSTATG